MSKDKKANAGPTAVVKPEKDAKEKKERNVVPAFRNPDGSLADLGSLDFPVSMKGKLAYCDYRILYYQERKKDLAANYDPKAKTRAKIEKAKARLAELEKELAKA